VSLWDLGVGGVPDTLTPRQQQILRLVATGLGDKEIGRRLGLSTNTVRTHLQRYYRAHQIKNRAEAAAAWITLDRIQEAKAPVNEPPPVLPPANKDSQQAEHSRSIMPMRVAVALGTLLVLSAGVVAAFQPAAQIAMRKQASGSAVHAPTHPATATPATDASSALPAQQPGQSTPEPVASPLSQPARATTAPSSPAPHVTITVPEVSATSANALLPLLNADRAGAGLAPLGWSSCLESVAAKSAAQIASAGFVQATSGPTLDLACAAGSKPAEAAAYWSAEDAAQLNMVLMASPAGRADILGAHRLVGAAWAISPTGAAFLVAEFA
jgi:DNA-binding CsgD family transcriptional regulator/uncharacterized protein YkwD